MDWSTPKRFSELPLFSVQEIERSAEEGRARLIGKFRTLDGVKEGEASFIWWGPEFFDSIGAEVTELSQNTGEAMLLAAAEDIDEWSTGDVRYLDGRWKAHHVWMISVPTWKFERRVFRTTDAFATRRSADAAPPLPNGAPPEFWLELSPLNSTERSRFCPNRDIADGLVPGGWDHEHCELCEGHVDPGEIGFVDLGGHWLCRNCYERYVHPA